MWSFMAPSLRAIFVYTVFYSYFCNFILVPLYFSAWQLLPSFLSCSSRAPLSPFCFLFCVKAQYAKKKNRGFVLEERLFCARACHLCVCYKVKLPLKQGCGMVVRKNKLAFREWLRINRSLRAGPIWVLLVYFGSPWLNPKRKKENEEMVAAKSLE